MSKKRFLIKILKLKLTALLVAVIAVACFIYPAQAVQIKRVQTGTIYFESIDIVDTATLEYKVDPTKSIILLTSEGPTATRDGNNIYTPYFEDSSNLAIARDYGNVVGTARYHVAEFNDGVRVIHGFSSMNKDTKEKTIELPDTVDPDKSVVIINTRGYITSLA
ncbi:MAG: hypothetical protein KKE64_00780 [Candidatus Omnitrophica bacterium]|nr:hypothetical protein [Candidatus Omnitrophota bacterium]